MGKKLFEFKDRNRAEELLKVTDTDQAKDFVEVLKAVALEYDLVSGAYPETEYEGYSVLEYFVRKYIKEPLGFNEEDWNNELLKIARARGAKK